MKKKNIRERVGSSVGIPTYGSVRQRSGFCWSRVEVTRFETKKGFRWVSSPWSTDVRTEIVVSKRAHTCPRTVDSIPPGAGGTYDIYVCAFQTLIHVYVFIHSYGMSFHCLVPRPESRLCSVCPSPNEGQSTTGSGRDLPRMLVKPWMSQPPQGPTHDCKQQHEHESSTTK